MSSRPRPWPAGGAGPSSASPGTTTWPPGPPTPSSLRPQARHAYTALAGVLIAGLAAAPGSRKDSGSSDYARARGRSRLAIRYFDDRVLFTDTHAWAYFRLPVGVVRVHHPGRAGGAGHQHHGGPGRDPDAGRRGAPAGRAPRLPGGRVGHRPGRDRRRRRGLAGVPGARPTSTCGPRTSGARRSTSGSGWASAACGPSSPAGCCPSSRACTRAASASWASRTRRSAGGEVAKWTDQAERIGRALYASALAARHATADELAWLIRHTLMGTLGEPPPSATKRRTWGAGEIETPVRGPGAQRPNPAVPGAHCPASPTPRSCPSPGSPT